MYQRTESRDLIEELQKKVIYILYAALVLKLIGRFVPVVNFISGILVAVFFITELFLLHPFVLVTMSLVVGVLFFLLPTVVEFLLGMFVGSLVVLVAALAVCYLLSGVIYTVFCGVIVSMQVYLFTAPLTFAGGITAATVGLATVLGVGMKGAIDEAAARSEDRAGNVLSNLLINIMVFLVLCWPILSYTKTITGVLACKPAVTLSQIHLNQLNIGSDVYYEWLFGDEEDWVFSNNFYHKIIRGTNNNITQGDKNRIAGNDRYIAIALNDMLYLRDPAIEDKLATTAYRMKETDAMVLNDDLIFIFGRNQIFVCGQSGHFTWKKTKYTSHFEKLSWEEQCEYIYDILERQNTEEALRFSYEEVGVVAYAQRNGLLLNYNRLTHTALFAQVDKKGQVTIFAQNTPGKREKQVAFKPNEPEFGQTWVMAGAEGILYLQNGNVIFLHQSNGWAQNTPFTNPNEKNTLQTIHYGWVGEDEDVYSVYIDEEKIWLDTRNIGKNRVVPHRLYDQSKVAGFAGECFYSIQYADNLISRLTYIQDVRDYYGAHEVRSQIFNLQQIVLDKEFYLAHE